MTTNITPTTRKSNGALKALTTGVLLVTTVFAAKHFVPRLFGGKTSESTPATVPPKVELPGAPATAGCTDKEEVRMLIWAWNAQQGLLVANGGPQATTGSLMCRNGVNLVLTRQDQVDQMQAELVKCASELGKGKDDCSSGAHYVVIMGDGSASFFAAVNPQLAKVCPECTAEVVGSTGYSRGEDKLLGLPAWQKNPAAARGSLISGYLRDGDWNIAMTWAGDNGICNNPDETTFDPSCMNWVAASDYLDAGAKYIAGYCEDRPVVNAGKRTGDTSHVCVNGVVTWTPGDVNVAKGRGGLVSIASTKEYAYQMPSVVIGLRKWDRTHRAQVVGMLRAITDGGQLVKTDTDARRRAAEISAVVYKEKDAAYWSKYFDVVTERDAKGLTVTLGGSSVNNLADNQYLFGLSEGTPVDKSVFAATYNVFGNIVVHYYPALVPSFPRVDTVVDTSYLKELGASTAQAEMPTYTKVDPTNEDDKVVVGRKNWRINFETASAKFSPDAEKVLSELYDQTVVTSTLVEINGHTDSDGHSEANRELSRRRALAVRDYLMARSAVSFPETRFRIMGYGADSPVAPNDTAANKAKNRRVEIVMRTK